MNYLIIFALFVSTVGFADACVDLPNPSTGQPDCSFRRDLCNDPAYFSLMTIQCPVTCDRCPSNSGTCVDKIIPQTGRSECTQTAYLCNDPAYFSFMTTQCPRTCGRCPPGK